MLKCYKLSGHISKTLLCKHRANSLIFCYIRLLLGYSLVLRNKQNKIPNLYYSFRSALTAERAHYQHCNSTLKA